jgi:hypothetical protein
VERAVYQYRVTKYDPRFRDASGAFLRDDWTSFDDIGSAFGGTVLTPEEYRRVESVYTEAALAFLREAGCASVRCVTVENHAADPTAPEEGTSVGVEELPPLIRAVLRSEWWCRFEGPGAFLHFGYDYYVYVGVPIPCAQSCVRAHESGLFVEPFVSPYHREEE